MHSRCLWFDKPHVKDWWNNHLSHTEIKEKYSKRIGSDIIAPFIVYLKDKPIGFIQYYFTNKVGNNWWPNEDDGTVGIDQFIGEEGYINKGYGTQMLREFIKKIFANPKIKKIITEADPHNTRAIQCYKKVGFQFVKEIITPDGRAMLFEIKR